ncbi:unnamed protein product [Schistocephalus solidus]|uniref:SWIM-type domain-containing protein n=1 Tax=Schistocephalus solidus TaxID=70667 RepID=A0A183SFY6_SCHSO|nr:unnamed protein product [Schistocephalus solidus]
MGYKNFRGGANFVEYNYTFEDCVANRKQKYIFSVCGCHSDELFVPFEQSESNAKAGKPKGDVAVSTFCRDIRGKTSQTIHKNYMCHKKMIELATTAVLDAYISPDMLHYSRLDPDKRKVLRHGVCPLPCHKMIYETKHFEIKRLPKEFQLKPAALSTYIKSLQESKLKNPRLEEVWKTSQSGLPADELIIVDIRLVRERVDRWQEELTKSAFNLMADIGGTLGLCAGISFLSSFFLFIFFGNAFYHGLMGLVYWFWWSVFQGGPPATPLPDKSSLGGDRTSQVLPRNTFMEEEDVTWGRRRTASRVLKQHTGSDFTNFGPGGWMLSSKGFGTGADKSKSSGDPDTIQRPLISSVLQDVENSPLIHSPETVSPPKTTSPSVEVQQLAPTAQLTSQRKSLTPAEITPADDYATPASKTVRTAADTTAAEVEAADADGPRSGVGKEQNLTVPTNTDQEVRARRSTVKPLAGAAGARADVTVLEGDEARSEDGDERTREGSSRIPDNGMQPSTGENKPLTADGWPTRASISQTATHPLTKTSDVPVIPTVKIADTEGMGARKMMDGPSKVSVPELDSKPDTNPQPTKSTRVDQLQVRSSMSRYLVADSRQREKAGGPAAVVPPHMIAAAAKTPLPEGPVGMAFAQLVSTYEKTSDGGVKLPELETISPISASQTPPLANFAPRELRTVPAKTPAWDATPEISVTAEHTFQGIRNRGTEDDRGEIPVTGRVSILKNKPHDVISGPVGRHNEPDGGGISIGVEGAVPKSILSVTGTDPSKKLPLFPPPVTPTMGGFTGPNTRAMEPVASTPPRGTGQLPGPAERLFASQFAVPRFVPTCPPRAPVMERLNLEESSGDGTTAYIYTVPARGEVDSYPLLPIARQEDMQDYLRNKYGRKKTKMKRTEEEKLLKINYKNSHRNRKMGGVDM